MVGFDEVREGAGGSGPSDPVLPVDTCPRTIVRKLNGIECERTYYVYSPLTNIVERVGTQGAPYGGTNTLRTVTTFYPAGGPTSVSAASGLVSSIRHEDGKLDLCDYSLVSNTWVRTVTHLHEQSPSPVSGKTTRDITLTNARDEEIEARTEAYIDGMWYTISRNRMTYNAEGKRVRSENLAGQVTTTAWEQFACTSVDELISAAKNAKSAKAAYDFDDICNRESSSERGTNSVYSANQLNKDKELKCGGYDFGVDVESDEVQIYGPLGKSPPAGRYLW